MLFLWIKIGSILQVSLSCYRLAQYDWTTFAWQGIRLLPRDFEASFGTLVVQETGLPGQLLSTYRCHSILFISTAPHGESELSCLSIAPTPREHKLTRLLFSLCAAVFSLVWPMRSIQTRLPWPLTPPTSGFPVSTMTTACMCGMSKTQRKWARCTLLCITLPVCGTLRYVVCRHRCWIVNCSRESHQMSCQIWMQMLTVEEKSWHRFLPVLSVFAAGPGNSSLHCNGWLNVWCYWKKKSHHQEMRGGKRGRIEHSWIQSILLENAQEFIAGLKKIVWDLWWASASKSKTRNKRYNLNCGPS